MKCKVRTVATAQEAAYRYFSSHFTHRSEWWLFVISFLIAMNGLLPIFGDNGRAIRQMPGCIDESPHCTNLCRRCCQVKQWPNNDKSNRLSRWNDERFLHMPECDSYTHTRASLVCGVSVCERESVAQIWFLGNWRLSFCVEVYVNLARYIGSNCTAVRAMHFAVEQSERVKRHTYMANAGHSQAKQWAAATTIAPSAALE